VVPLNVIKLGARGSLLESVKSKVRLVALDGELGEIGSVLGVVGKGFKIAKITDNHYGVRIEISHESEGGSPGFLVLSGNVAIGDNRDSERGLRSALSRFKKRILRQDPWDIILPGFYLGVFILQLWMMLH
jgi:hypothetical protein